MKALTLTPPWCWVIPPKIIETRGQYYSYRGPFFIHAGKNLKPVGYWPGLIHRVRQEPFASLLWPRLKALMPEIWQADGRTLSDLSDVALRELLAQLPMGQLVAVADLVDCIGTGYITTPYTMYQQSHPDHPLTDLERSLGDYGPGRFGLLMDTIRPLPEPIPWRGFVGLWDVPDEALPPDVLALAGVS